MKLFFNRPGKIYCGWPCSFEFLRSLKHIAVKLLILGSFKACEVDSICPCSPDQSSPSQVHFLDCRAHPFDRGDILDNKLPRKKAMVNDLHYPVFRLLEPNRPIVLSVGEHRGMDVGDIKNISIPPLRALVSSPLVLPMD